MSMSRREVAELMVSDDLKPFWDEVDKIRRCESETLFSTENPAYLKSLKALDRVLQIPRVMSSSVATTNAR